jgi:GH15 family glucan-1,4-alpha-glucosidase
VAHVLASYPERQRTDGFFLGTAGEWAANGAALRALGQHFRLTGDGQLVEAMVGPIAKGAHWINRRRDEQSQGLLPAGVSADHPGHTGSFYADNFWSVAGLKAAAEMLAAVGQPEASTDAAGFAEDLWAAVVRSLGLTAERLGTKAMPAGPDRRIDSGLVATLLACWPLGLMAPDDERLVATRDLIRDRFTLAEGEAVSQGIGPAGLGTHATLRLAGVELAAGDLMALDRLGWFLDAATATWTWPEALHPRLGGGSGGEGHNGLASAELLRFVRDLLVREVSDGLALSSMVPDNWLGQGWEVHEAPTAHGRLSYAVRWHGERPALLWELVPRSGPGSDGRKRSAEGDG